MIEKKRKFYHENEKEREILKTLLWIYTCSHNTTITFLYMIPLLLPANMKNYFLWLALIS